MVRRLIRNGQNGGPTKTSLDLRRRNNLLNIRSVLMSLSKTASAQASLQLLRDMRVLVIEADAASLTTVATSCRRARQWELGIDLLRRMTDSSMEVDDVAVNSAGGSTATGAGMPLSLWQHCLRSVLGPDAAAKGQAWPMAADLLRGMACRRMTTHAASATLVLHVVGWKRSLDMLFWLRRMSMQIDGVFQSVLADAMAKAACYMSKRVPRLS